MNTTPHMMFLGSFTPTHALGRKSDLLISLSHPVVVVPLVLLLHRRICCFVQFSIRARLSASGLLYTHTRLNSHFHRSRSQSEDVFISQKPCSFLSGKDGGRRIFTLFWKGLM